MEKQIEFAELRRAASTMAALNGEPFRLTARQTARLLGRSPSSVTRLRATGRLVPEYDALGHSAGYNLDDVEAFLTSGGRGC